MKSKKSIRLVPSIFYAFVVLIIPALIIHPSSAKAADYPSKPITFYIPFGAGGTTDSVFRLLLDATGKQLGQQLVPVNKPGAGGALGLAAVMNAKPDGYTLGACTGGNLYLMPHMPDSPYKDLSRLTFIMNYVKYVQVNLVRSDSSFKTWKEFIDWSRKNPKAAKVGCPGGRLQNGSAMTFSRVEQKEGVEFTIMPFTGAAESQNALLGGHITLDSTGLTPTILPYLKEGKLRLLSYAASAKIAGYENLPNFPELYGFEVPDTVGVVAPSGLSNAVLQKLEDAFAKAVKDPDLTKTLTRFYTPLSYKNRAETTAEVNKTFEEVGEVIKNLKAAEAKK